MSNGVATFSTSTLALGSHPITATFIPGANSCPESTSAVLTQVVGVPADGARLQALQRAVTRIEAQSSGSAYSSAVDSATARGFSDCKDTPITPIGDGLRFNFNCEPRRTEPRAQALPMKAPPVRTLPPREWDVWAEVRGTGWDTNQALGDIRGGQTNAFFGVTRSSRRIFSLACSAAMRISTTPRNSSTAE